MGGLAMTITRETILKGMAQKVWTSILTSTQQ